MTSLKKKIVIGVFSMGIGIAAASGGLAINSIVNLGKIGGTYPIAESKKIEYMLRRNPELIEDAPSLVKAYSELTSAEGYEEAREEYDSADKEGGYALLGLVGGMFTAFGAGKWKKRIIEEGEWDR